MQTSWASCKMHSLPSQGTTMDGFIFKPDSSNLVLDCHPKDAKDPSGVKSRTGFLLTFGAVPSLWQSVTQECIALSTTESNHIVLSTVMHRLAQAWALLLEISAKFNLACGDQISTISTVFKDCDAAKILAATGPLHLTPHSKSLAVKCHWF